MRASHRGCRTTPARAQPSHPRRPEPEDRRRLRRFRTLHGGGRGARPGDLAGPGSLHRDRLHCLYCGLDRHAQGKACRSGARWPVRAPGRQLIPDGCAVWSNAIILGIPLMPTKTPITVAHGDGIGPEIMGATLQILEAAGAALEIETIDVGEKVYLRGNTSGIEPSSWQSLLRTKVFLKASLNTPA